MGPSRRRADILLVERGLFESRAKAQEAIAAGLVSAEGSPVSKASDRLPADAAIIAEAPHPWVSRAGVKLAAGLDAFAIDPAGCVCLDLGASTGGFTDVLLARGAQRVYAVDVGHGQLHPRLARDARVKSLEGTDARHLTRALVPEPVGLAVADVSFISLRLVLPPVLPLLAPDATLVALVKPQFEAGRAFVKKGVVRDEAVHRTVCRETAAFVEALGFKILGLVPSPILGGDGNREFLIGARRG
ncbi:MAG TPA: TlyA family RNA methyltransferase [Beijerinckiaceae bacterium]|jgi:23S rRNA (cytidine1920-2'-O)/16S rRNA (cytidine1409-2'-O)-methyltransferase